MPGRPLSLPSDAIDVQREVSRPTSHLVRWCEHRPPPRRRLNHLVGYGATYYSYLYAQCLAASLWERRLAPDPCGQGAGELLRRGLLEPGGAKEAARYVSDLFAEEPGAGAGVMTAAEGGGQYPDPGALLRQLGLER